MNINQPTIIRCLAGGFPKPYVSWWRETEMLPLKTARFEVTRDYSLSFTRVELTDLGPYVCQAYSGFGKPKSISVTLKAIGPIVADNAENQKYLQYVLDPSEIPTVAPPVYRPIQPRPTAPPTQPPTLPRNGEA